MNWLFILIFALVIVFLLVKRSNRDPYADKPLPIEKTTPEYLSDDVKNNWQLVFSNDGYIAYWNSTSQAIKVFQATDFMLREELDNDGDAEDAAAVVHDWYENYFGYPYVALDDGDVIVVWNGKPKLEFKSKATGEVLYEYEDELYETPDSRETASFIAEQKLPEFRSIIKEIGY